MNNLTLHFFPLTCARVTMTALEQTGVEYEVKLVDFMAHEQKSPAYLAINPAGKVPALQVGKRLLVETVAIILYLDQMHPAAKLLPSRGDPLDAAVVRSDLIWCATTLHPVVRQIRATYYYTTGDVAPVKAKGLEAMATHLSALDRRFEKQTWWFGDDWSAVDAYLAWVISGHTSIGGDLSPYPALVNYMARMAVQPAYSRMFAREGMLIEKATIQLPPGVIR